MKTIYRVQDSDGRGPWKPGFSHKWVEVREDHDHLYPWYAEFKFKTNPMKKNHHFGCGCVSIDQLKRWFTESEYKTLLKHGYRAVMMDVDGILGESSTQCIFERALPLNLGVKPFNLYGELK